jgi:hypothetical protein
MWRTIIISGSAIVGTSIGLGAIDGFHIWFLVPTYLTMIAAFVPWMSIPIVGAVAALTIRGAYGAARIGAGWFLHVLALTYLGYWTGCFVPVAIDHHRKLAAWAPKARLVNEFVLSDLRATDDQTPSQHRLAVKVLFSFLVRGDDRVRRTWTSAAARAVAECYDKSIARAERPTREIRIRIPILNNGARSLGDIAAFRPHTWPGSKRLEICISNELRSLDVAHPKWEPPGMDLVIVLEQR